MTPTMKLRWVAREEKIMEADEEWGEEWKVTRVLQQWWEDLERYEPGCAGEWRDVPVEIEK